MGNKFCVLELKPHNYYLTQLFPFPMYCHKCYHQNLLSLLNKMIYIYIFFFIAYGWPVRLEMQNPFFGPKSAHGTKG